VGPNGAGKTNALDSLGFISESLSQSLDNAFANRGGINEVRRRSFGHPRNLSLRIDFELPSGAVGFYAFTVTANSSSTYDIKAEQCVVQHIDQPELNAAFRLDNGVLQATNASELPKPSNERLFLQGATRNSAYREVFENLSQLTNYNVNPAAIAELQRVSPIEALVPDGSNICTVLKYLARNHPDRKKTIETYLGNIVPGITGFVVKTYGSFLGLQYKQKVSGADKPWNFEAAAMSDGTLRATGILTALFQRPPDGFSAPKCVCIEEPETSLHPYAMRVMLEALYEASADTQVLITSHSPDLLDAEELAADQIRAVTSVDGITSIVRINDVDRGVLHDGLYSAGDLLRLNRLTPDQSEREEAQSSQLDFFAKLDH
jgi:predicted ATPase